MARKDFGCGRRECGASTAVDDETITFGTGDLDFNGFWEHPCAKCAAAWKKDHPNDKVWPDSRP